MMAQIVFTQCTRLTSRLLNSFSGSLSQNIRISRVGPQRHSLAAFSDGKQGRDSPVWKVGKLNHVAIAVPDIEKASAMYRDVLGAKVSDKVAQPEHGVYTVFVELDNTKIELLLPYGEKSPIQGYLDKNKSGGLHHICLEVNDIDSAIKDLKAKGIRTLGETWKTGAHGKPVIFLHPKDCNGVLVELEQV